MQKENLTTAEIVANYIIGMISVDNLKLQKLLYYSQAVHLARVDEVLFKDQIEAWRYGPVIPSIYRKYKQFGFENIKPEETDISEPTSLCPEQMKTIDMVLDYYGAMSAVRLVNETHSESPWKDTYKEGENIEISVEVMRDYYKKVLVFS